MAGALLRKFCWHLSQVTGVHNCSHMTRAEKKTVVLDDSWI
jgi:hypothetical protein